MQITRLIMHDSPDITEENQTKIKLVQAASDYKVKRAFSSCFCGLTFKLWLI